MLLVVSVLTSPVDTNLKNSSRFLFSVTLHVQLIIYSFVLIERSRNPSSPAFETIISTSLCHISFLSGWISTTPTLKLVLRILQSQQRYPPEHYFQCSRNNHSINTMTICNSFNSVFKISFRLKTWSQPSVLAISSYCCLYLCQWRCIIRFKICTVSCPKSPRPITATDFAKCEFAHLIHEGR